MAQAIINLGEHEGRIVNIVKGKYGLKNKSEAISLIVKKFEEAFLEPEIRPEYLEKLSKIQKGRYTKFSSVKELRKYLEDV